jgi:hypothetical protein
MPTKPSIPKSKTLSTKSGAKKPTKKLDLYAKHKNEYVAGKLPSMVRVGPARYLSITGRGMPEGPDFTRAVGALYNVAFTIKMARKLAGQDYAVTKLEGLWWREDGKGPDGPMEGWSWQLMIRVPTFINAREVKTTIDSLIEKGKDDVVRRVELVDLREGECVQILHTGPYTQEHESVEKMRTFAAQLKRKFTGRHHEIYLSDPRRVKPEKLRTILRQPVG